MSLFFTISTLQSQSELLTKAWEISPYNGIAYGAIVVILGVGVWWMNQQRLKERKLSEAWQQRYVEMLTRGTNTIEKTVAREDNIIEIKQAIRSNSESIQKLIEFNAKAK